MTKVNNTQYFAPSNVSAMDFLTNVADDDSAAVDPADPEPTPAKEPTPEPTPPEPKKPSDEEAKLLKEVMAQKAKAKELQAKLDALKDIDPDAARAALKEAAELKAKKEQDDLKALEEKGEYARIIEQLNQKNDEQISAIAKERDEARQALAAKEAALLAKEKSNLFANSNYIRDNILISGKKVEVLLGDYFDYDTETGDVIAYDKPKGAKERTPIVDDRGSYVSFETAIEKLVTADKDFEKLVKSTVKPGAQSKTVDLPTTKQQDNNESFGITSNMIASISKKK